MKVYKLVEVNANGERGSYYIPLGDAGYVTYSTEAATVPCHGCGPLAAFVSKSAVRKFTNSLNLHEELWEAEAIKYHKKVSYLWQPSQQGYNDTRVNVPDGTVFCAAIQLTKQIKFPAL